MVTLLTPQDGQIFTDTFFFFFFWGGGGGGLCPWEMLGGLCPWDRHFKSFMEVPLIKWNSLFRPVSTHFYSCNAMWNQSKTRACALVALLRARKFHPESSAALSVVAATQLPRVSIWLVECNMTLYIIARQEF